MAVKGKGKQVASPSAGGGGKRPRKNSGEAGPSSTGGGGKRRRRSGALQFVDDAAYVAEDDEIESGDEDAEDDFVEEDKLENVPPKVTGKSQPLPFLVKEEELSGDELEELIKGRYGRGVKYADDIDDSKERDNILSVVEGLKEPTIWRVKCMVGRERQMAFCFMQKFVDLRNFGTKVPIISAFALDHVRGFVFVEAEKACDVTEACKGFCSVYASRISAVPATEVPNLLSSRAKPFELSPGTWVRMKSGNYKGDLARVHSIDEGRKRVMVKLVPRVDLQAISKKFGGAVSLKQAAVPAPRLISSHELEFFRPHIEMKRDRQSGDIFEVLDGLMFKDGYLYKRVAVSSLVYWGVQPSETELLKFSTPREEVDVQNLDWVSTMYGRQKKKLLKESNLKASTSKENYSKESNLKASTSNENYEDEFNVNDLVLFGRKDFGVIIAVEKDGFRILKGGPEGSAVTVRKQDIKKGCEDRMFTAVDQHKKVISINDNVRVVEGPFQGKEGIIKHMYKGILFIYNESESENNGYFCAKCESCENVKKPKELTCSVAENLEDQSTSMLTESPIRSYEQPDQRDNERRRRNDREQLFSIGQTLRIRKGPLKGYLCRVVRIFRNDVTVKLDSLVKIITVQAQFLSVPARKGDDSSGGPTDLFGSQDMSFLETQGGSSWDKGLPSFGSDSWQPFSSSALPVADADQKEEVDPWCKKVASSSAADSAVDTWGKAAGSSDDQNSTWNKMASNERSNQTTSSQMDTWQKNVEVWSSTTTQKTGSDDSAWAKAAGGSSNTVNLDASGGSCWDTVATKKCSEMSDNWGQSSSGAKTENAVNDSTDPWGSKVKEPANGETEGWGKASMYQEKLDSGSGEWGQPFGNSSHRQGKDTASRDANQSGAWNTAAANWTQSSAAEGGNADTWPKAGASSVAQDDAWGMSKDRGDIETGGWNNAGTSSQNNQSGGSDTAAARWNQPSAVEEGHMNTWGKEKDSSAAQDDAWGKSKEKSEADGGAWNKAGASNQFGTDNWDKPKSFGGGRPWNKEEEADGGNQRDSWSIPGNFEGGRGFGRGRGRGRESGDWSKRDDRDSWKRQSGNDSFERPSWQAGNYGDNEAGDSDGYRGSGRGRGGGRYGGRGRGGDNNWRHGGDHGRSEFGRGSGGGDKPSWAHSHSNFGGGGSSDWNRGASTKGSWSGGDNWNALNPSSNQTWSGSQGNSWATTKSFDENQSSNWSKASSENEASEKGILGSWKSSEDKQPCRGQEQQDDPWASKVSSAAGAEDKNDAWNNKGKEDKQICGGQEQQGDPWVSKVSSAAGAEDKNDAWNVKGKDAAFNSGSKRDNAASISSGAEDKADPWNAKGGGANFDCGNKWSVNKTYAGGWNNAGSSSQFQTDSWSKPTSSGGDQEPAWGRPRYSDEGRGYGHGGFGRGDRGRGRGRGRSFGDNEGGDRSSSWCGGRDRNDESSADGHRGGWNRQRDFEGGRGNFGGRGRGRYGGRGGRNPENWSGSGDQGGGWGSDRDGGGNNWNDNSERRPFGRGRGGGGGWSQSSDQSNDRGNMGNQTFLSSKPSWAHDNSDSWGQLKPSGADDQSEKGHQNNMWSKVTSSAGDGSSAWGKQPDNDDSRGVGSWGNKTNENDGGNATRGSGGSSSTWEKSSFGEAEASKKAGSWESAGGSTSQGGGGGSSWEKLGGAWNGDKGGNGANDGW